MLSPLATNWSCTISYSGNSDNPAQSFDEALVSVQPEGLVELTAKGNATISGEILDNSKVLVLGIDIACNAPGTSTVIITIRPKGFDDTVFAFKKICESTF